MKTLIMRMGKIKLALLLMVLIILAMVATNYTGGINRFVAVMRSGVDPIYRIKTSQKAAALTFDGIWGSDTTEEILEILEQYNVKATFFLTGKWIENNEKLVERMIEQGHEIGNLTYNHPHMNNLNQMQQKTEIEGFQSVLGNITDKRPMLFRPPFGEYSGQVLQVAEALGYNIVLWDVDSGDWKENDPNTIIKHVLKKTKRGSIILFHLDGPQTHKALPTIIKGLIKDGYVLVTVSDLLNNK